MPAATPTIERIRDASRRLVRELGFLRNGLAGVGLPPSAVHAVLEIERREGLTAADLSDLLGLEKSSVSRMLRRLAEAGYVTEAQAGRDGRTKPLALTARGIGTATAIHDFAHRQVSGALEHLEPDRHRTVMEGLRLYADALAASRGAERTRPAISIETGYRTGALARCTEMHARYYAREAGFGASFEAVIASGLAEFAGRLDRPRNGLWLAVEAGQVVGTVAIDGEDLGEDLGAGLAHLRWLIVDDGVRGQGVGRGLLSAALEFCERQGFEAIHLWTFRGLHAARHLYESRGFSLAEERPGRQWGTEVLEQRFARPAIQPA